MYAARAVRVISTDMDPTDLLRRALAASAPDSAAARASGETGILTPGAVSVRNPQDLLQRAMDVQQLSSHSRGGALGEPRQPPAALFSTPQEGPSAPHPPVESDLPPQIPSNNNIAPIPTQMPLLLPASGNELGSSPSMAAMPDTHSPSLFERALAAGEQPAKVQKVRTFSGLDSAAPEVSPTAQPAKVLSKGGPPVEPPPPEVPALFARGKSLFAQPVGSLSGSTMRAKACKALTFHGAREGDPALAPPNLKNAHVAFQGRNAYRPGISIIDAAEPEALDLEAPGSDDPLDTASGVKQSKLHAEIRRCMGLLTISMVANALCYDPSEAEAMDPKVLSSELFGALARRGVSSMQGARRALVRLYDFALARGVQLTDFRASTGMISAFLSSQTAVSMPRQLLLGLRWAATFLKVCPGSLEPILDGFKSKARPNAPRPAMCFSLRAVLHIAHVAVTYRGVGESYVRSVAAGVHLMCQGSLRWADTFGCTFQPSADAIDGHTVMSKTGPMPWWAEKLDALGDSSWLDPLMASLRHCRKRDFVFRRATFSGGRSGDPSNFNGWGSGPSPKAHVVKCLIFILMLPPLNLPLEEAKRYSRLHGARRFFPTVARFLSGHIPISIQDRLELGRWKPGLIGDPTARAAAAAGAMPNLYSMEGARERCVKSRGKVAAELRRRVASLSAQELQALPTEGCGMEFLLDDHLDIAAVDPDPDLSDDESGDEQS